MAICHPLYPVLQEREHCVKSKAVCVCLLCPNPQMVLLKALLPILFQFPQSWICPLPAWNWHNPLPALPLHSPRFIMHICTWFTFLQLDSAHTSRHTLHASLIHALGT